MEMTQDQTAAHAAVDKWYASKRQHFYVAGYAGTGKTSLARDFADGKNALFGAFTGKAASVLTAKGCPAMTLHRMMYKPASVNIRERELAEALKKDPDNSDLLREMDEVQREGGSISFRKNRDSIVKEVSLVVVDECSMVSKRLGEDLQSFGKKVLWLGDPGQLPPVRGAAFVNRPPNFTLEEIHRQAAGSGIIQLATAIRKGEPMRYGYHGAADAEVAYKAKLDYEVLMRADQVICGKNHVRHSLIRTTRKRAGISDPYPVPGDKLICLRNDYEVGVFNGVTCILKEIEHHGAILEMTVDYEGRDIEIATHEGFFLETYGRGQPDKRDDSLQHFGYGHVITGHKSQGSQWDSVVVCDDRMQESNVEMRKRWLYTVVTRAAKQIVVYT